MDHPRDDFLARPGRSEDQHRDVGLGGGADPLEDDQHLLVAADHLAEALHRRRLVLGADRGAALEERVEQVAQRRRSPAAARTIPRRRARARLRATPKSTSSRTQFSTSSRSRPNVCISDSTSNALVGPRAQVAQDRRAQRRLHERRNRASISAGSTRRSARRRSCRRSTCVRPRAAAALAVVLGSGTALINRFISIASPLRCPWQRTGSEPPLVSIRTFEKNRFVSIFTDATCAMWIVCSRRPNHRGVYCTTLGRRDRDLRRKQVVAAAQAAGAEHVLPRHPTAARRDHHAEESERDGHDGERIQTNEDRCQSCRWRSGRGSTVRSAGRRLSSCIGRNPFPLQQFQL